MHEFFFFPSAASPHPKESYLSFIVVTKGLLACILFLGSRRLSVGALVGLQVPGEGEVVKKTKTTIASSFGSTPGVTQGGVTKIRNKTIPIINPMVKTNNWPTNNSASYKKGILL